MNYTTESFKLTEELANSGLEHMRTLGELNLRTWEKIAEQQKHTFGLIVDTCVKQLKLATQTREVSGLINGQMELTRELRDKMMAENQEAAYLSAKASKEFHTWIEQGASVFASNINKVTEKSA